MSTRLSGHELAALDDAARKFSVSGKERSRALRGKSQSFCSAAWRTIAEQGWLSMLVPEQRGGLSTGVGAFCVVARRLGRGAVPEPFVAVGTLATLCLARSGGEKVWRERLGALMAGDLVVTLAWQAPLSGFALEATVISFPQGHGQSMLRGRCRLVACPASDAFIVCAKECEGLALYWVARDAAGLSIEMEPSADGRAFAVLQFDQVDVALEDRLCPPSTGEEVLCEALDTALLANAAELLGLMDATLELTFDYMRTREQFGSAIGGFQALQHRAVDMWMAQQLAEAALGSAICVFEQGTAGGNLRSAAASGAKARAAEAAMMVVKEALQIHGAIGFSDEYDLGIHFNRALVLCAWLGNAAQHRGRFASMTSLDTRSDRVGPR